MKAFFHEFMVAARLSPRIYFAIFVGAYKGIKSELDLIEAENAAELQKAKT